MKVILKKSFIVISTLLFIVALSVTAFAAGRWVQAYQDDSLKIKFDGAVQTFIDPSDGSRIVPLIYNNRTYLPVRAIAELTGLGVGYDESTRTVLLTSDGSIPSMPATTNEFEKAMSELNISTPGKYTLQGSGTRKIMIDDFKSLTEYGFDVSETLADNSQYSTHWVHIDINLNNYSKEDQIRTLLYNQLVIASKDLGWAVKQTGTNYAGRGSILMYKDGLYLYMDDGSASLGIAASQMDLSNLMR